MLLDREDTDPVSWPDEQAINQQVMHSQVRLRCVLISMSPCGSSLAGGYSVDRDGFVIRWIQGVLSFGGCRRFCHSVDRDGFVIRWIEGILLFGGCRGFCHSVDAGDFVIRGCIGSFSFFF